MDVTPLAPPPSLHGTQLPVYTKPLVLGKHHSTRRRRRGEEEGKEKKKKKPHKNVFITGNVS